MNRHIQPISFRPASWLLVAVILCIPIENAIADQIGHVYLSFSATGRDQNRHIEPCTPFDFYLVVDLADEAGINAIEGTPSPWPTLAGRSLRRRMML